MEILEDMEAISTKLSLKLGKLTNLPLETDNKVQLLRDQKIKSPYLIKGTSLDLVNLKLDQPNFKAEQKIKGQDLRNQAKRREIVVLLLIMIVLHLLLVLIPVILILMMMRMKTHSMKILRLIKTNETTSSC